MFSRALFFLLVSCVALCLAQNVKVVSTKATVTVTTASEAGVVLAIMGCTTAVVAIVLMPTMFYYKYCQKNGDEVY